MKITKVAYTIALSSLLSYGAINGIVFRDLPLNGTILGKYGEREPQEPPVAGVSVKGTDENGNVATATTDESGKYVLENLQGKVRVEFSNWPTYLEESFRSKNGSSVQFAKDGDEVNFALQNPDDYLSTTTPDLVTSVYFNGATNGENSDTLRDIVTWKYNDYETNHYNLLVPKAKIGTVWGLAYDNRDKSVYAAAFLRRHTGLLDNDNDGYGDIGVIYKISPEGKVEEFFRFQNGEVGTIKNDADRELPLKLDTPSADPEAFAKTAQVGIGDIDLTPDGKTLYVVNLYQRKIYAIDTEKRNVVKIIDIPKECSDPQDAKPFALKYHDDELYLGVTCVALNSQKQEDLKAMVYRYNSKGNFEQVIDFPLTYRKGKVLLEDGRYFLPWVRSWSELHLTNNRNPIHPQPLLSDIEFVYEGGKKYMVISILDRTGLQTGYNNVDTEGNGVYEGMTGGDLLIASMGADGKATLESGGQIDGRGGSANEQGPNGGEFFYEDNLATWHEEVAQGGMAYIAGSDDIAVNSFDPVKIADKSSWRTGGPRFFNLKDGTYKAGKKLYTKEEIGTFGKAGGVGDLEVLGDLAPIEIGNRVWKDENGDGVQDANENGIAGIKLNLSKGDSCSNIIESVETDSEGNYVFSKDLEPNESYRICIDPSQFLDGKGVEGTPLENLTLTGNVDNDKINSDAKVDATGTAIVAVKTADYGESNYNYDIGFRSAEPPKPAGTASIGDFVWFDKNMNGIQDDGEVGVGNVKVQLLDTEGNLIKETQTDAQGKYKFTELPAGSYVVKVEKPRNYPYFALSNGGDDDSKDSDVNPSTGISPVITISDGEEYKDLDAGLVCEACNRISVEKSTNGEDADTGTGPTLPIGSPVIWRYVVKNGGNIKLKDIILNDDKEGLISCPQSELEAGEEMVCVKEGVAKEGQYENIATVVAKNPLDHEVKDTDPSHYIGKEAKIYVDKRTNGEDAEDAPGVNVAVGGEVTWDYRVKNVGGIKLTDINVVDDKEGVVECPKTELEPNEEMVCTKKVGLAQEGQYHNKVTAQAKDTAGKLVEACDGSNYFGVASKIDIEKSTNGEDADTGTGPILAVGDKVTWSYVVTNKGNVRVSNITVTDDKEGVIECPSTTLDPNKEMVCKKEGVVKAGQYENIAKVEAKDTIGQVVEDSDPSHYFGSEPKIDIEKSTNGEDADTGTGPIVEVGSKVVWSYTVKNSGNSKVVDIKLTDDKEGAIECPKTELEAGEEMVCTKEGIAKAGQYENIAKVEAKDITGNSVSDSDPSHYLAKSGACVGDFIWDDLNANGIQEEGEKGLEGATVQILTENGEEAKDILGEVVKPQVTSADGKYQFCRLNDGNYIIKVTPPQDYRVSPKDVGDDDSKDNDIDENGVTQSFTLKEGDNDLNWDAGLYKPACIGDYVWEDIDGNGIQDSWEIGVEGVQVTLMDENGEPAKDIDGNAVAVQTTKSDGKYKFCNLMPGNYKVKMLKDDPLYYVTYKDRGDNELKDSDIDTETFTTDVVTLKSGDDKVDVDGGYFRCGSIIAVYTVIGMSGYDTNNLDLSGLKVKLFDENGNLVAESVTDKNGQVKFTNLIPGTYRVEFEQKDGLKFTIVNDEEAGTEKESIKVEIDEDKGTANLKLTSEPINLDVANASPAPEEPQTSSATTTTTSSASATNIFGIFLSLIFTTLFARRAKKGDL